MKNVLITFTIISMAFCSQAWSQSDPFDPIVKALRDSDARQLAAQFHTTVELGLAGKENSYSQAQCEMVMKDFFRKTPADSFTLVQKGTTNGNTQFAIGNYQSGTRLFQVYIKLLSTADRYQIHQLRFEEKQSSPSGHDHQ